MRSAIIVLAAATMQLTSAVPMNGQESVAKKAVPAPAAQTRAEALIARLFAAQLKNAKTDKAAALALAAELLAQGKATRDDDSLQFAALKLAGELAARGGDHERTLEAVEELAKTFKFDTIDLKSGIYAQVEKNTTAKADAGMLAEVVLNLVEEALATDNFAAAALLMATAEKAVQKSEKLALAAKVEKRAREVEDARKAFAAIKPHLDKINGGNEKTLLAVGRYYCFIKGNYDKGLPLLAKGSDAVLKDLAQRDLAKPKEPRKQADLADDWYKLGEVEKGLMQRQTFQRTYYWYQEALPGLMGLTKIRVAKQVEDLAGQFPPSTGPRWAAEIARELRTIKVGHSVLAAALSGDGKWIVSTGDNTLRLWDAATGQKIRDLVGHTNYLTTVAISADKKWLLSGAADNTMRLWNLENGQEVRRFAGHNNVLRTVLFLPDGQRVISSCDDGAIRIFDQTTGNLLKTIPAHVGYFTGLAVSKDGKRALSCGADKKVRIWNLENGTEVQQFLHQHVVQHGALSPDGKFAVTTAYDNKTNIWDADTGKLLHSLPHPGMVWCVAISPDGRRLYTGGGGGPSVNGARPPLENTHCQVRVFDLHTGKELRLLEGHTGHIYSLSLSADSRYLLSGGLDNTVRLWGAK